MGIERSIPAQSLTASPTSPGPCRLVFRDAADGQPIPGVSFLVVPANGPRESVESVAGPDGSFAPATGDGWTLSLLEEHRRLLRPSDTYSSSTMEPETSVWCYRTATVTGYVDVEDPDRLAALGTQGVATVSARPVSLEPVWGGRRRRSEAVGTPPWVQGQKGGGKHFLWTCAVKDREYRLEIPLIGTVAVMAWAPGHSAESMHVDAATAPGSTIQANFRLRKSVRARIRVLDEAGVAVSNATVQFVAYREVPTDRVERDSLGLEKKVAGLGMGIVENAAKGTSIIRLKNSCRTDQEGRAQIDQGDHGRRLLLLVCAEGMVPFLRRLEKPDEFQDAEIVLRRNRPARAGYRLVHQGRPVAFGASLMLLEMVDGLTLDAGTITAGSGGVFPANSIVADRQYYAIIHDSQGVGLKQGAIRFGSEETIDISAFD